MLEFVSDFVLEAEVRSGGVHLRLFPLMSLRAKRGNLLPITEIASAGFFSLATT
jgi:hypothetical protein